MARRAIDDVIEEARTAIAAGRVPDTRALQARIRALGGGADELELLERVLAVHRARARLARRPVPPAPKPSLRTALRTRPTISANMDVRRQEPFSLVWDAAPGVTSWEVRLSERADARSDYEQIEAGELPGDATRLELPLGDRPLKVHLIGRGRDGRLVRRAVISGLTRDGWNDRWQRRASAS